MKYFKNKQEITFLKIKELELISKNGLQVLKNSNFCFTRNEKIEEQVMKLRKEKGIKGGKNELFM